MSWWSIAAPLLASFVMLLAPGAFVLYPLRMSPRARVALAAPTSLAMIGLAGVIAAPAGIRFTWVQPLVLGLLVGALMTVLVRFGPPWARAAHEDAPARRLASTRRGRSGLLAVAICWIVGSAAMALTVFHSVPSPALFSQTYDNVFHLNATMRILDGGDASSLRLRTLTAPMRHTAIYPAAWHATAAAVAQLAHASVPLSFTALAIAVNACAWLPGIAWFSSEFAPARERTRVYAIALVLSSCLVFYPAALLIWGVLYPTYLAYAVLPAGLALAVVSSRRLLGRPRGGALAPAPAWVLWVLAALWVAGAAFAHPRVLFGAALVLAPLALGVAYTLLHRSWPSGRARRRRTPIVLAALAALALAVLAGAARFVYRFYDLAHRPIADHLNGVQARPVQSVWRGLWQALSFTAFTGRGTEEAAPALLFALAAICAAIWAFRTRQPQRWLVVSYALVALLFAIAAGSPSDLAKLATALWYKDRYRLAALLPALAVPLVATYVSHLSTRLGRPRLVAPAATALLALASWVPLALAMGNAAPALYRLPEQGPGLIVTGREASLLHQLPSIVPKGQRVLGDPWDSSSMSWVLGGREPVFPHLRGAWDPDRMLAATALDRLGSDPRVCPALRRLHVHYVLTSPRAQERGDPAQALYRSIHRAAARNLLTEVRHGGGMGLYRIDRCG